MDPAQLKYQVKAAGYSARASASTYAPKVGDEIFEGTDYPRTWDAFIGQEQAIAQLQAACYSARWRQKRCDHILLATGLHGVGKTSLAKLIAADLGTGLVEVSGKITLDKIRPILKSMEDNDVLFIDEIHQLVSGGMQQAEWLLHLLQDGVLMTANGPEPMPSITVIAATTDKQKLPETILSRFPVCPVIVAYSEEEAVQIADGMAKKLGFGEDRLPFPNAETLAEIVRATNNSPREMKGLLIVLRDATLSFHTTPSVDGKYDLSVPLAWSGLTHDGLDKLAQDYLITLITKKDATASIATIQGDLGEPGPMRHTEKLLSQKGYIQKLSRGRQLTESGVARTMTLLRERGLIDDEEEAA